MILGWRPWRHITHKSTATWWVRTRRLSGAYAAACASSWSTVYAYSLKSVNMWWRYRRQKPAVCFFDSSYREVSFMLGGDDYLSIKWGPMTSVDLWPISGRQEHTDLIIAPQNDYPCNEYLTVPTTTLACVVALGLIYLLTYLLT